MKLTRHRHFVWERCLRNDKVLCIHCGGEVDRSTSWDVSHVGAPAALGGIEVGVGHRACNQLDNIQFVIPLVARANRLHDRHMGITGPGLSDTPLPAGRRSGITKKLNGKVEPRLTGAQKHQKTMAALYPAEFLSKHGRPE